MEKYDMLLIGFIVTVYLCSLYKATNLPEGTPKRDQTCQGNSLSTSCDPGEVVAVQDVQYGTKLKTTCGLSATSSGCCDYSPGDCFLPDYTDTAQQRACSGKELCSPVTVAQADNSSCGDLYQSLNHYLTMSYYCINETRIESICTSVTETNIVSPIYLKNQDYPNKIRGTDDSCSCSVESTACSSRINVYLLHLELVDGGGSCPGTQKIIIDDAGTTQTLTCSDNNDYAITLNLTSSTNYITVTLENQDRVNDGYLWIGFEATDNTASLRIDCPAIQQVNCKDCESLDAPTNGSVIYSNGTTYQSVATFSCDTGYTLVGNETRTCQASSSWSNSSPVCNINDCESLDAPTNGSVIYSSGTTYQSVATFSCDTGYTLGGNETRTCQASSSWNNSSPVCNINDCESLDAPTNGSVIYSSGTTYQSVATFSCDTGYTLVGNETRTCQASSSWNNSSPVCNINDCESLDAPTNGSVIYSSGTTFQSVATFSCDTGYTLVGNETRTCQASSSWNNSSPVCNINDCESLDAPTNGSVIYSSGTTYQSVATFSCDTGYTLVGNESRTCQASSSWNNSSPVCNINDCESLDAPTNGSVIYSSGTTYQSVATFSCDTGYTLVGNESRTCQASSSWNNSSPVCNINDCESLDAPTNGSVIYSSGTTYQSVATFSCDTGYTLSGNKTRTCQASSSWNNSSPVCNINDCESLDAPTNGSVIYSSGTTYQSVATFSCDTGYTLVGNETRTCQASSSWNNSSPVCNINDCESLDAPTNGSVIYSSGTTYQSVATFSCDTGYTLGGNETRTCQASSSWNNSSPVCNINDCESLDAPTNGSVMYSSGTTYQSVATFSCDTGYTLVGNESRTCQASSSWNNSSPVCNINDCESLDAPTNGSVIYSSGTTYQSVATFSCDTGYTLSGNKTRTCQASSSWNNSSPVCNINDCETLDAPTYGSVIYSSGTTYQSVATFSCDTGYTLVGNETRTCQASSSWNNSSPVCNINDCESLDAPTNGSVIYSSGTTYQSVATFSCDTGYTLVGDETRTCQASNSWNNSSPVCNINDCESLDALPNGSVIYSSGTTYQSVATFSCDTGYTLEGDETRTCQASSLWNNSSPDCIINDCESLDAPTNGSVIYSSGTTYQSVATFSCDTGYTLEGDETRTCQATSSWNNSSPVCYINDCGNITAPDNGTIIYSSGTVYQSVATYSCDVGYSVVGVVRRECQANSSWSDSDSTCVVNDCGDLTDPDNGYVLYSNPPNSLLTATYHCNIGYTLNGTETRQCPASEIWTNNALGCIINDCGVFNDPPNSDVAFPNGTTYQSVAVLTCKTNYTLFGQTTRECQANSSWTDTDAECYLDCSALDTPRNGSVETSNGFIYQSVANFSCVPGYTLLGNSTIICENTGRWSDDSPTCQINDCRDLTAPENGTISYSSGTTYQSVATFSCDTGYTRDGDEARTCQANEEWSNTSPDCVINDCGDLTVPTNGIVTYSSGTTYQSVATFSCNTGYTLDGYQMRTCQASKTWSNNDPVCRINDCGDLTEPENGKIFFSSGTLYQSVATFSCDTGYTRDGGETQTCQANKEWSSSSPVCKVNDCGNLTEPENGTISYSSGTTYRSVATFSCDTGYTRDGDETRTCQANEEWSNTSPNCQINDCGSLRSPDNGSVEYSRTSYRSEATYSCESNFTLTGVKVRICQADGSWNGTAPTCRVPDSPTTTRKPRTIDTDVHSTITIAVVVTIGIIVLAGSSLAVFVRTHTFQSMIKPQYNSHRGYRISSHYQNRNGMVWQNKLNSLPDNGYSSSAYSFYYGQNAR